MCPWLSPSSHRVVTHGAGWEGQGSPRRLSSTETRLSAWPQPDPRVASWCRQCGRLPPQDSYSALQTRGAGSISPGPSGSAVPAVLT